MHTHSWRGSSQSHSGLSREDAKKGRKETFIDGARNFFSLLLGPVFVQAFALTFLGEWGDRSQIATIALGAAHVRVFYFLCFLLVFSVRKLYIL